MKQWLADRIGIVRVRQVIEELQHRLAFVPLVMTFVAVIASQITLLIDRGIGNEGLPWFLATTVDSSRSVLATIAGGLITAFTLLVSMMLVAVQLASGQFSPRTLRNWLSDVTLRRAVGLVLATTVFCLLGLRSARDFGDDVTVPNITAIVAVFLGVASLVAVVRAVDHVTTSLQIGTVAQRIVDETIGVINSVGDDRTNESPRTAPAPRQSLTARGHDEPIPETAIAIESTQPGWVQQIDTSELSAALPDGASAWIDVVHGAYITSRSPLVWVDAEVSDDERDAMIKAVQAAFALGKSRTMQRDVGFGIAQLADIAVRALSPGVNDPQTAQDITRHLAEVMVTIWSYEPTAVPTKANGRTIFQHEAGHLEHLRAGFDPIRHHGRSDPAVMMTIARTLIDLRNEVHRRDLPGPIEPLDAMVAELGDVVDDAAWLSRERNEFRAAISVEPVA